MQLSAEPLDRHAFAPFGDVVDRPDRAIDASGPGWSWWAEIAELDGDERPQRIGYLALEPAPLRFDWAERHLRSSALIVPLEGESVLYVAQPGDLSPDRLRAFRIRPGQAVTLGRGVWHGAPLALEPGSALVFLLAETGREDTEVVRFEDAPVEITV